MHDRVDVLLYLEDGAACDARLLRRNLRGTAGVYRVVEACAG